MDTCGVAIARRFRMFQATTVAVSPEILNVTVQSLEGVDLVPHWLSSDEVPREPVFGLPRDTFHVKRDSLLLEHQVSQTRGGGLLVAEKFPFEILRTTVQIVKIVVHDSLEEGSQGPRWSCG